MSYSAGVCAEGDDGGIYDGDGVFGADDVGILGPVGCRPGVASC